MIITIIIMIIIMMIIIILTMTILLIIIVVRCAPGASKVEGEEGPAEVVKHYAHRQLEEACEQVKAHDGLGPGYRLQHVVSHGFRLNQIPNRV